MQTEEANNNTTVAPQQDDTTSLLHTNHPATTAAATEQEPTQHVGSYGSYENWCSLINYDRFVAYCFSVNYVLGVGKKK